MRSCALNNTIKVGIRNISQAFMAEDAKPFSSLLVTGGYLRKYCLPLVSEMRGYQVGWRLAKTGMPPGKGPGNF